MSLSGISLHSVWSDNANRYCAKHFGRDVCIIPQEVWNDTGEGTLHAGFLVTRAGAHMGDDPEFVRLFERVGGGDLNPKVVGFAIIPGITFDYADTDNNFFVTDMNEGDYMRALIRLMRSDSLDDKKIDEYITEDAGN